MINGQLSHWWTSLGGPPAPRDPLPGPTEADVAIVGAGYTGLWTAWYLREADPGLRVVLIEREHAGFGASGRNGGWLSGLLAGSRERWASEFGRDAVIAAQREMFATVGVVADWCAEHGVDCDLVRSGQLDVATSAPALERLRAQLEWQRSWGFRDDDWRALTPDEVAGHIRLQRVRGGVYTPHCARVHPAKLVRGLAAAVERAGAEIYERTAATAIEPHLVRTGRGDVRARWVVRATEGYTHGLARRRLIPMNSAMIATAPLDAEQWERIGWERAETLRETAHLYCYLQRTPDGRIAIGGRGIPYRFGSRTDHRGEIAARTAAELEARLERLFGVRAPAEHGWAGVLGVSRDWCPAVHADPGTGLATAGGYVGDGVSTSNLAGRTLRDLLLGRDTQLTRAPWARHRPKGWEPEPFRFLGIRSVYGLYRAADRHEERTQRPSPLGRLATLVAGR